MRRAFANRPSRRYIIERDAEGLPYRMVWQGDYVKASVTYVTCPKCGSDRMSQNRCMSCWHDARNEYWRRL